jgi:hypothetical protein
LSCDLPCGRVPRTISTHRLIRCIFSAKQTIRRCRSSSRLRDSRAARRSRPLALLSTCLRQTNAVLLKTSSFQRRGSAHPRPFRRNQAGATRSAHSDPSLIVANPEATRKTTNLLKPKVVIPDT